VADDDDDDDDDDESCRTILRCATMGGVQGVSTLAGVQGKKKGGDVGDLVGRALGRSFEIVAVGRVPGIVKK
jgi:hypothetical protein